MITYWGSSVFVKVFLDYHGRLNLFPKSSQMFLYSRRRPATLPDELTLLRISKSICIALGESRERIRG